MLPRMGCRYASSMAATAIKRTATSIRLAQGLGAVTLAGGAFMAYKSQTDEGFNRSMIFWLNAFPVYAHYRIKQLHMEKWLSLPEHEQDAEYEVLHDKYAPTLHDVVLKLKGFYVKLAQIGSTRPDFLPRQYLDRCTQLQSDVPAREMGEIQSIIEKSYGKPIDEIFQSIESTPLGAASIGQVHRAVLKDGRTVVVKIQYPDAEHHFRNDIGTMKDFCQLAQPAHVPFLDEVEKQFMTEFDYTKEAQNLLQVKQNIEKSPYRKYFVVPEPILELCTKEVLVMEYLKGKKLIDGIQDHFEFIAKERNTTVDALKEEQERKDAERAAQGLERETGPTEKQMRMYTRSLKAKRAWKKFKTGLYDYTLGWIAPNSNVSLPQEDQDGIHLLNIPEILRLIIEVHGYEIFVDGCFNGDPHPGNILLLEDGRMGLIDYGQVKRITPLERAKLAKLVIALAEGSQEDIVRVLINDIELRTKHLNPYVLEKFGRLMMDKDNRQVTEGLNVQLFMEKLESMDPIVHQPDQYVMAFRVSLLLRGLSYALRYDVSHAKMWLPLAKQVLADYRAKHGEHSI